MLLDKTLNDCTCATIKDVVMILLPEILFNSLAIKRPIKKPTSMFMGSIISLSSQGINVLVLVLVSLFDIHVQARHAFRIHGA